MKRTLHYKGDSMQYRQVDKNLPPVSILGFGCMRFYRVDGSLNFMDQTTPVDEKLVNRLLHYAMEQGVNYYDTAYTYLGGMSESILGKQFTPSQRQNNCIATKLPAWKVEKTEDMERFLHEQLSRLQTDYIDYYLVHSLTKKTWNQVVELGIFDFLDRVKKSGKVRSIGFSFHDQYPVYKTILNAYPWDFCQILFNYHDTTYQAGFQGYLDAVEKGIGVISMEPLLGGKLATQLPQEAMDCLHSVHPEWSPAEWALRWVWNHEGISTLLSGMNQMNQVQENCRIASQAVPSSLQEKELQAIQYVKEILEKRTRVRCTSCSYCMPCPQGVKIPSIFSLWNEAFSFADPTSALKQYQHIPKDGNASACIHCQECEPKCPQQLPISQLMEEANSYFSSPPKSDH
jgi:hypothetical protein